VPPARGVTPFRPLRALSVRPAHPRDAAAAAALLLEPVPSQAVLLGSRDVAWRIARASFLADRSVHGHRHAFVAVDGPALAGLVVAVPGADFPGLRLRTGLVMLWAGLGRARALIRAGVVVDRLTPPVPADCLYVSSLAVAPPARRRGVGAALVARVEAEARRRRLPRLALDVNRDSSGTRSFYARLGFVETAGASRSARGPATGFLRLEKPVGATAGAA
jgi:GNAT superfamily N-acetyltransferase